MTQTPNAKTWVEQLSLEPHPEGGYFKRIYNHSQQVNTPSGDRDYCTSIHYLLESHDFSAWHRIKSDELWYYHGGEPLIIHYIDTQGSLHSHVLGQSDHLMIKVPANQWFCAHPAKNNTTYTLVSCAVIPGFDFADFELAYAEDLVILYPQHSELILRYCRQ